VTAYTILTTIAPQYAFIPLDRAQFNILVLCVLIGWVIWSIWLFKQYYQKEKPPESPRIAVEHAKEDSEAFRQFEVQLRDGLRVVRGAFQFVTIRNLTGPTVDGLEGNFKLNNVVSKKVLKGHGPFLFVFSSFSDHLTIPIQNKLRDKEFREVSAPDAIRDVLDNTNDGKLASRAIVLHRDSIGKTVGLVFTIEGFDGVMIPNYRTKSWVVMPCSFNIDLYFSGEPALSSERIARFHVEAKDWKSLEVVDWEAHLKRQDERMRQVYAPLYSAVASMRLGENDPLRRRTLGTPFNPWTKYTEIMQKVKDVFDSCPDLVENEQVWKGWMDNEGSLRTGELWLGDKLYAWFDAIEAEYNRIYLELKSR